MATGFILQTTEDGSKTIYSEQFRESYHSVHGAVVESRHVFIQAGLQQCKKDVVRVFEVGFGTGLNAYLTLLEAQNHGFHVEYQSLELHPLGGDVTDNLGFADYLASSEAVFKAMHGAAWNEKVEISDGFSLHKVEADLLRFEPLGCYDVVYFDAFSPNIQPELWAEAVFAKIYERMDRGGVLTTYCAKGEVRRTMERVGLITERLPGPPGKREMLRAVKK